MQENLTILLGNGQHMCFQTLTHSLRPSHWTQDQTATKHTFTCGKRGNKKLHSVLLCTKTEDSFYSNIIATYYIAVSPTWIKLLHYRILLRHLQVPLLSIVCVCVSSGATDFPIYLLLPLPSQTDHLSPVAIGSPRRKSTPDSFLHVLNRLISI